MPKTRKTASGPKYNRIETIALKLDVHPRTVRRMIDNGVLEAVKIGGSLRVSDDELQRLLLASRVFITPEA